MVLQICTQILSHGVPNGYFKMLWLWFTTVLDVCLDQMMQNEACVSRKKPYRLLSMLQLLTVNTFVGDYAISEVNWNMFWVHNIFTEFCNIATTAWLCKQNVNGYASLCVCVWCGWVEVYFAYLFLGWVTSHSLPGECPWFEYWVCCCL